jgi:hypothetical protein
MHAKDNIPQYRHLNEDPTRIERRIFPSQSAWWAVVGAKFKLCEQQQLAKPAN